LVNAACQRVYGLNKMNKSIYRLNNTEIKAIKWHKFKKMAIMIKTDAKLPEMSFIYPYKTGVYKVHLKELLEEYYTDKLKLKQEEIFNGK